MIVMFSGKVGSGKTSLSKKISELLGSKYVSFGEYVTYIANKRELNYENREVLQNIGEEMIRNGWNLFCTSLLRHFEIIDFEYLIVDGMRHIDCYNTFRELYPNEEIIVVYINIDNSESLRRQKKLEIEIDYSQRKLHMTEKEVVTTIPYIADLILDGTKNIDVLITELVDYIIGR